MTTETEIRIEKELDVYEPPVAESNHIYKVHKELKLPVSKHMGTVWKERRNYVVRLTKSKIDAWEEAIAYYLNDQSKMRKSTAENAVPTKNQESENIVFSTVNSLIPALYSKNPSIEVSANSDTNKEIATSVERLVNILLNKRVAPGVNLKRKVKKGIVNALLTNRGILKVNWTYKADSSNEALLKLKELGDKLVNAEDPEEIKKLEGDLIAIEETIDLLSPMGASVQLIDPTNLYIDPDAKEQDASDAKWIMECDYLPTAYIVAKFATDDQYGRATSIYEPTQIINVRKEEDDNLISFEESREYSKYGYDDEESFKRGQLTKVWYIWDKTTRRVYLFNDKDWTYPIWVWNDPLGLEEFFPYYILSFWENPRDIVSKGEVSYFLDQQDGINGINAEYAKARRWATSKFFHNKRISRESIDQFLNSDSNESFGVELPDGASMNDIIRSVLPPSMQYEGLFNKQDLYSAVERITGLSEALRGGQFKTNTTNQAVQHYQNVANTRLDEKIDLIEDWIGKIGWAIAQLCLMNMSINEVISIIGQEGAVGWREGMLPQEIQRELSMRVVGGSTQKPTSQAKQRQAIELGQVLGQFAGASPMSLIVALKLFEQAFDDVIIKEEDWQAIQADIMQRIGAEQQQQQGMQQQSMPQQPQQPI